MHLNVTSIYKSADEMDVNRKLALWHRVNFLKARMRESADRITALLGEDEPVAVAMARIEQDEVFTPLARELRTVALTMRGEAPKQGTVTEEMKSRARDYPIEKLVDFSRGVAVAFCHPDKRPSLSHNRKANRAHCFPCGKSFDPIGVLMTRDGKSFTDAVRFLCNS